MSDKLTVEEIAQIRERSEKATEAPWVEDYKCGIEIVSNALEYGTVSSKIITEDDGVVHYSDATFIAHAREDVPKLLAEIERYKYALERIAGKTLSHYVKTDDYKRDLPSIKIAREALEDGE